MAGNDVRLRYITDVSSSLAAMGGVEKATRKQIAEVNRATAALAAYDRAQAAMQGQATKTVSGLNATRGAAQNLQAQIFDIGVGLQGGQNPLTILTQQTPQVIQALSGAESVTAVFAATLANMATVLVPIAAVITAVYTAWQFYSEDTDRANRITEEVSKVHRDMQPVLDDTRLALLDVAEATGELTAAEAAHIRSAISGLAKWRAAQQDNLARVRELNKAQQGWSAQIGDLGERIADLTHGVLPLTYVIDAFTTSTAENQQEIDALNEALRGSTSQLSSNVEAHDAATAAQRRNKAAADASREAIRAQREELEALERIERMRAALADDLARVIEHMSAEEIALTHALEKVDEAEQATAITAYEASALRRDAVAQLLDAQEAAYARDQEAYRAAEEKKRLEAERTAAMQRQLTSAYITSVTDSYGSIGSILVSVNDMVSSSTGKVSAAVLGAAIGLGVAQAEIQGALAAITAIGPPPTGYGPTPIGLAAAAAAELAAQASVATIVATNLPKFHDGGIIPGPKGAEVPIMAQAGERVQSIAEVDSGRRAQPIVVVSEMRYKHRMLDRVLGDHLAMPTTNLSKALRGLRGKVGHA